MKENSIILVIVIALVSFIYGLGYRDGKQKQEGRIHEEAIHAGAAYYLTNYSGEKVFCWKTQEE